MQRLEEKVYCSKCERHTNHNIIMTHEKKSSSEDDIQFSHKYHIVQCAGCDEIAFVDQYGDEDMWEYANEGHGERVWVEEFRVYPEKSVVEGNPVFWIERKEYRNVPGVVQVLYSQIIEVYNQGYFLLATIGMRTLIEAICLDVGINKGYLYNDDNTVKENKRGEPIFSSSLEGEIFGLFEENMIIWDQAIILQKIRDIGNAAVHEIKEPSFLVFKSAMQIIEQVLNNVYELKVHKLLKQ
ncbi:DUF4145 domain-containing protein [Peribacillus loiseleuriae]|uniref:DUF4145 domain-containing protein n=1 Tax=Peribacillus loiseleuriae TaxID=1679170 RepID=A0A0K9GV91_9BACI|nr:DUF4145 domain-containing protein [Peribacillus loiseleuriae]KMY50543.1 hypothetical protein AC625_14370 [Peribacillus loiseleuriae]